MIIHDEDVLTDMDRVAQHLWHYGDQAVEPER